MAKIYLFISTAALTTCVLVGTAWGQSANNLEANGTVGSAAAATSGPGVDFTTGAIRQSIPIMSITDGGASAQITATYSSEGNQLYDLGGWIGYGWHLNVGGSLTREIRGVPDDDVKGWFAGETINTTVQSAIDLAYDRKRDAEPDVFSWQAGGYGGKFVVGFHSREILQIPQTDCKIIPTWNGQPSTGYTKIDGFQVITPEGVKYTFGGPHVTAGLSHQLSTFAYFTEFEGWNNKSQYYSFPGTKGYPMSYQLRSIKHPVYGTLQYNYAPAIRTRKNLRVDSYSYFSKISDICMDANNASCRPTGPESYNGSSYEFELVSITGEFERIDFTYAAYYTNGTGNLLLKSVKKNEGVYGRNMTFIYGDFESIQRPSALQSSDLAPHKTYKPALLRVVPHGKALGTSPATYPPHYAFGYNSLTGLQYGGFARQASDVRIAWDYSDYMGFAMGAPNQWYGLPYGSHGGKPYGHGNRNPHHAESEKTLLKTIRNPFGGVAAIAYEPHKYSSYSFQTIGEEISCPASGYCEPYGSSPQSSTTQRQRFTVPADRDLAGATIELGGHYRKQTGSQDFGRLNLYLELRHVGPNNTYNALYPEPSFTLPIGFDDESATADLYTFLAEKWGPNFPSGQYDIRIRTQSENSCGPNACPLEYLRGFVTVRFPGSRFDKTVPGSRVASITTTVGTLSSTVNYAYEVDDSGQANRSSGQVAGRPQYSQTFYEGENGGYRPAIAVSIAAPNRGALTYASGTHVRYTRISETTVGLGRVVREFYRSISPERPVDFHIGVPPPAYDRKDGRLMRELTYAYGATQPYSVTEYKYDDSYQPQTYDAKGARVTQVFGCPGGAGTCNWYKVAYPYRTPLTIAPRATEVKTTLDNRVTTIVTQYNTSFKGAYPYQVTTSLPDGTSKLSVYAYSNTYETNSAVKDQLIATNRIGEAWRTYHYKNGELLSAERSEYAWFDDIGGAARSYGYGADFLMPVKTYFWSYIVDNNAWGSLTGRSFTKVASNLKEVDSRARPVRTEALGEVLPTTYAYDSDGLLRTETYGAAVTVYGYTDRLPTSTTAPDGTSTTIGYDDHNRLAFEEGCGGGRTEYTHPTYETAPNNVYATTVRTRASASARWDYTYATKDGMGRDIQTISVGEDYTAPTAGANGSGAIFHFTTYDAYGRVKKKYSPVTRAGYVYGEGRALYAPSPTDRHVTYNYEASPRGRLETQVAHNGYTTSYQYGYNSASESSGGGIPATYSANQLSRVRTTDPGGHVTESFTDSWGNLCVAYVYEQGSASNRKQVRYAYDIKNDLRRVTPFAGATDVAAQTYRYDYDYFGKVISKVEPGKQPELFYRDYHGRLAARQDFYSRTFNGTEHAWGYVYDDYGNVTQAGLNAGPLSASTSVAVLLSESTFDYTPNSVSFGRATSTRTRNLASATWITTGQSFDRSLAPCGQAVTSSATSSIDWGSLGATLSTAMAYDADRRLSQSTTDWRLPNRTMQEQTVPTYGPDDALESVRYRLSTGSPSVAMASRYDKILSRVTYDRYGQLTQKRIRQFDRYGNTDSYLQHVDYAYDDIGRLTAINRPLSGSTTELVTAGSSPRPVGGPADNSYIHYGYDQETRDLFYEDINYTSRQAGASAQFTPTGQLHNSLVRQTVKQTKGRRPVVESYDYDGYLRLKRYEAEETYATDGTLYHNANSIHASATYQYDLYSRAIGIQRQGLVPDGAGVSYKAFDNLSYDYNPQGGAPKGPQVRRIVDLAADANRGGHGAQVPTGTDGYVYNANGDVTYDPYRNFVYTYNLFGLVASIQSGGAGALSKIEYTYTGDGELRQHRRYNTAGAVVEDVHYVGGARVHLALDEVFLPNDVGAMMVAPNQSVKDVYYHTDHVGNVMMAYHDGNNDGVIDPRNELLEESRYFPYGMKLAAYGAYQSAKLPFAFNGAEQLDAFGGLQVTTFRTMAPETALWSQVDPKAEWDYGVSPYSSMGGNPISRADPKGDFWHIVAGAVIGAGINVFTHWDDITADGKVNWGDFGKAAGIGAAAGAVGAATGGAALGAAGLSATSFAGGALAGGVGAAYSSPILGVGNNIAFNDPYSVKQWGLDIVMGAGIGGVAGGAANLIKNARPGAAQTNFWTDNVIGTGRSRWSFTNSPIQAAKFPGGSVTAGRATPVPNGSYDPVLANLQEAHDYALRWGGRELNHIVNGSRNSLSHGNEAALQALTRGNMSDFTTGLISRVIVENPNLSHGVRHISTSWGGFNFEVQGFVSSDNIFKISKILGR